MHDALFMHMLKSTSYLADIFDDSFLLEVYVFFHSFLYHKLQVTFLCPFNSNEQFVKFIIDEPVQVLNDVWMV